jgi:hypothetical protein
MGDCSNCYQGSNSTSTNYSLTVGSQTSDMEIKNSYELINDKKDINEGFGGANLSQDYKFEEDEDEDVSGSYNLGSGSKKKGGDLFSYTITNKKQGNDEEKPKDGLNFLINSNDEPKEEVAGEQVNGVAGADFTFDFNKETEVVKLEDNLQKNMPSGRQKLRAHDTHLRAQKVNAWDKKF